MALRGRLVGRAYVLVTADTTPMKRAIKRDAQEAGALYSSEFGKEVELRADRDFQAAREKFKDALIGGLVSGDFDKVAKQFGSIEEAQRRLLMGIQEERDARRLNAKEFAVFENEINKWASKGIIARQAREDAAALHEVHLEAIEINKQFDRVNKAHTAALREDLRRTNTEFERSHAIAIRLNREFDKGIFDDALRDAALHAARFNAEIKKSGTIQFGKQFDEARVSMEKLRQGLRGVDALEFRAARSARGISGGIRTASRDGDKLLSVFSGISKTMEGISHRGNPFVDLLVAPLRLGASVGKLFEGLGGKLFKGLATKSPLLGTLTSLTTGAVAAFAAVAAMTKAASLLSSALSLVGGMATLAASAIGGGLVGALLIAASAIPAVLAGLGGFILFFADFKKQAPEAVKILSTFGTAFQKAFDKEAFRGMEATIGRLVTAITPLAGPLASGLGRALNVAVNNFVASLTSGKVLASLRIITEALPRQVEALGRIFTNLTTGVIGFFSAIIPYADDFLESLRDITQKFSDFTNSTKGREKIQTFFLNMRELAFATWRIIQNLARAIGAVFSAAVGNGNGPAFQFLVMLDRATAKFAAFLQSAEGQNKLKIWFDDALRAAEAVGALIGGIGATFGALDTEKSRNQVIKMTEAIGHFLTDHADDLERFVGFIDGLIEKLGGVDFGPFVEFGSQIATFVGDIAKAVQGDALGALDAKFDGIKELSDTFKNDLNPALHDFLEVIQPVVTWLQSSAFKNLADSFRGTAAIIDGVVKALSGWLNVLTGLATLDGDKIKKGVEQLYKGAGEAAFGAFVAGFAGSGVKGILDKALGIEPVTFKDVESDVTGLFDGIQEATSNFDDNIGPTLANFFTGLGKTLDDARLAVGQWFTDTRLSVGQWFTDTFKLPDFSGSGSQITSFFDNLGATITNALDAGAVAVGGFFTRLGDSISKGVESGRLAIGQFFTDLATNVGNGIATATAAVGQFFTDLPNNVAYWLGAATGAIFGFFYNQATAIITSWQETVIPFFQNLPGVIEAFLDEKATMVADWFTNQWNAVFAYFETVVIPWVAAIPGRVEAFLDEKADMIGAWFSGMWNAVFAYFETVAIPWIVAIPGRVEAALDTATDAVANWFTGMWNAAFAYFETVVIPWVSGIPGRLEAFLDEKADIVATWFSNMWNGAFEYFEKTVIPWVSGLPGRVEDFLDDRSAALVNWFSGMWGQVMEWWSRTAVPWLRSLPGMVVSAFSGVAVNIGNAIATQMKGVINGLITQINSFIQGFNNFSPVDLPFLNYLARGGIVEGATHAIIGESGPEAVVPLNRALSQVDPAVRWLSAIAQNKPMASGGVVGSGSAVSIEDGAFRITVPYANPELVAQSVMDRIAERAFI